VRSAVFSVNLHPYPETVSLRISFSESRVFVISTVIKIAQAFLQPVCPPPLAPPLLIFFDVPPLSFAEGTGLR